MQTEELRRAVIGDIVLLSLVGIRVVVVHGGGPEINEMLGKVGKQPVFVNGLRHTDEETMGIVQMVLCGRIGKQLAQLIGELGGRALGLSGLDGRLLTARRAGEELGLVGEIVGVDPAPVTHALAGGYIPVVSTVACGEREGEVYNINADTAAAKLAAALGAEKLMLLTDVRGLMRDPKDESTLIPMAALSEVPQLIKTGVVAGGMIPKVECCVEAVRQGVSRATILDGRIPHSILIEMLSDEGTGTMIM
jgi:acetylglutamate kinase